MVPSIVKVFGESSGDALNFSLLAVSSPCSPSALSSLLALSSCPCLPSRSPSSAFVPDSALVRPARDVSAQRASSTTHARPTRFRGSGVLVRRGWGVDSAPHTAHTGSLNTRPSAACSSAARLSDVCEHGDRSSCACVEQSVRMLM